MLGATGLVGREMLRCLEQRAFPLERLALLASEAGGERRLPFRGRELPVVPATPAAFEGVELVLSAASREASRALVPAALERGAVVVDNSSAFRLDEGVPLVVPEVNAHRLAGRPRLVANPNCSTIQLVCALAPLCAAAGLERVQVATYQSLSGAGAAALAALDASGTAGLDAVPAIGAFDEHERCEEEAKLALETRKILEQDVPVDALCVRVPTRVGHGEAVWVTTREPLTAARAMELLAAAEGVACDGARGYATPRAVAGTDLVRVGRVRSCGERTLSMWVVADNVRKGAALNAVQIAERLRARA